MLVKINFKNGNRTVFNADYYDSTELKAMLNRQTGIGDNFFYIKGYKGAWLMIDYQSIQSMIISKD